MKSNTALIVIGLLFLVMGVTSSVTVWAEVSSAVKIGMFAFGFGAGIAAGSRIAYRRSSG
jgi:tellurite resistance protein TehA-like permease